MVFVGWKKQSRRVLLRASDQEDDTKHVSHKEFIYVGKMKPSKFESISFRKEEWHGKRLTCEHGSSWGRTEYFAVSPSRTVTKKKDEWHLCSPWSSSEPTLKATPAVITIGAQEGSGARFWQCPVPALLLKTGGDKFSQRICELFLLIQRLEMIPGEWRVACLNVHRRDQVEAETFGMPPSPAQSA